MLSPLTKLKENISNTSLSIDALVFTDCVYFYFFDLILILFLAYFFRSFASVINAIVFK